MSIMELHGINLNKKIISLQFYSLIFVSFFVPFNTELSTECGVNTKRMR